MKISPLRIAFSALASLAMATSANAAEILNFGQNSPANTVLSTGTSLSTTGTITTAGAVAGIPAPPNTLYTETFAFTSAAAPTGSPGNQTQGGYAGTFSYVDLTTGNTIAGSVKNATLSTITNGPGGTTATFNASDVTFTIISTPILQTAFGLPVPALNTLTGTFSLTINSLNPQNPTSLAFTGRAAGIITAQVAAVPEPASVVMTGMALVAGLGGLGLRRIKASRA